MMKKSDKRDMLAFTEAVGILCDIVGMETVQSFLLYMPEEKGVYISLLFFALELKHQKELVEEDRKFKGYIDLLQQGNFQYIWRMVSVNS